MGFYYELTPEGDRKKRGLEKKRLHSDITDEEFVLLEVGRSQPVKPEHFFLHMEDNGYDRDYVRDICTDLHFEGYIR